MSKRCKHRNFMFSHYSIANFIHQFKQLHAVMMMNYLMSFRGGMENCLCVCKMFVLCFVLICCVDWRYIYSVKTDSNLDLAETYRPMLMLLIFFHVVIAFMVYEK